ncbi:hypothetical protein GLOTRDRAFT_97094 [Gloeophyllum trabeum ATCC 11539]|uniref:DUF8190 domain-containing protein n=1 Tax=Gloeophyllum trabeum (strain ATCC 11539 / FP-39264 / Madison 617) TaxID=670483 RepID=S7R7M7_GLOTA|nr:uncharacterized protein GLOTRDRAFT_97094 [Gloeophyllum trabeum ATCC 11539]EPQ50375.1 hypothetical protein GLOTRDRAFT_97094 [Gloeophyllum trabeum ATCC 11539]
MTSIDISRAVQTNLDLEDQVNIADGIFVDALDPALPVDPDDLNAHSASGPGYQSFASHGSNIIPAGMASFLPPGEDAFRESVIVHGRRGAQSTDRSFSDRTPIQVTYRRLEDLFDRGRGHEASNILQRRWRSNILLDATKTVQANGLDSVQFFQHANYLDCHFILGRGIGIDVGIPQSSGMGWQYHLDLSKPHWYLRLADPPIGFNISGRVAYMGYAADLRWWTVFAPNAYIAGIQAPSDSKPYASSSSLMALGNFRRWAMFIAHCLAEILPGVAVYNKYPHIDNSDEYKHATSMGVETYQWNISLVYARRLAMVMKRDWTAWVEAAPSHFKNDFITDNSPLLFMEGYGQNAPLGSVNFANEATDWRKAYNWNEVATSMFSIAHGISVREISEKIPIAVEDIIDSNPDGVFDEGLNLIDDLADIDLEVTPIFDNQGTPIPAHHLEFKDTPCGTLANLGRFPDLFRGTVQREYGETDGEDDSSDGASDVDDPSRDMHRAARGIHPRFRAAARAAPLGKVKPSLFPHAFLGTAGHASIHTVPDAFKRCVQDINLDYMDQHLEVWQPAGDDDLPIWANSFIQGTFCQAYNEAAHSYRSRTAFHDAELGLNTRQFTGALGKGARTKRIAQQTAARLAACLPHEAFNRKISAPNLDVSFRFEQTFVLNWERLAPDVDRSSVAFDVIASIVLHLRTPDVFDQICETLYVFTPGTFPKLYSVMTFPLTSLIETVRAEIMAKMDHNGIPIDTGSTDGAAATPPLYHIELLSCLERALNFAHTGNRRVIETGVMNPLHIGRGLIVDGTPCLNRKNVTWSSANGSVTVSIDPDQWPTVKSVPCMSSARAQLLTYRDEHYQSYMAMFTLHHAIHCTNVKMAEAYEFPYNRALSVMHVFIGIMQRDIVAFVATEIQKTWLPLLQSQSEVLRKLAFNITSVQLKMWRESPHPLAPSARSILTLMLRKPNEPPLRSLPFGDPKHITLTDCASALLTLGSSTGDARHDSPLPPTGSSPYGLRQAISFITALFNDALSRSTDSSHSSDIIKIIRITLSDLQIHYLPTHPPSLSDRGRPITKASAYHWVSLGQPQEPGTGLVDVFTPQSVLDGLEPDEIEDSRSPWSILSSPVDDWPHLLHKDVLPEDFRMSDALGSTTKQASKPKANAPSANSDKAIQDETIKWVEHNIDMTNPVHKLVVFYSAIFALQAPNVMAMLRDAPDNIDSMNPKDIDDIIRNSEWLPATHSGSSLQRPYLAIFTVYVLACVETASPLYKKVLVSGKGPYSVLGIKCAHKYIVWYNMVRLGLARTSGGARLFGGGGNRTAGPAQFALRTSASGQWCFKSYRELEALWHSFVATMKDPDAGPYTAIRDIVGPAQAARMVKAGVLTAPVGVNITTRAVSEVAPEGSERPAKRRKNAQCL